MLLGLGSSGPSEFEKNFSLGFLKFEVSDRDESALASNEQIYPTKLAIARQLKNWGIRLPQDFDFETYVDALMEAEERFAIGHHVLFAVTVIESGFNVAARSNKGAMGLFQFMPQTAELYWPKVRSLLSDRDPLKNLDTFEAVHSVRGSTLLGAYYLSTLKKIFKGNLPYALASYNVGPGAFERGLGEGRFLSADYVFRVYHLANEYTGRL